MKRHAMLAGVAMALVLLAGCGSTSDIFGGGSNTSQNRTIRGTVQSVDPSSGSIVLVNASGYTTMLSNSGGDTVRIYYDNQTTVNYQGQNHRPEDLERGDQVDVQAHESNNGQLVADSMNVTYNANTNNSTYPSNGGVYNNNNTITGTIRSVDTSRRTVTIDPGYGSLVTVDYDQSTPVYFNGRTYMASDLEQGDRVTVHTRDVGTNRMYASSIDVTYSVSGTNNSGSTSSNYATIRGTVRYVDTSRRTIELEQASWMNGFLPNAGGSSSIVTVQYDANASVNVNGQMAAVSGLERGDVIEVQVSNPNSSLPFAQSIVLVRDVRR